ncbi:MAG: 4Fe-4S dicluster domain-containing protein [Bacillota bacterium]
MSLKSYENALRDEVRDLLQEEKIRTFVGYEAGYRPESPVPVIIREAGRAEELVLDEFCGAGLTRYVLDESTRAGVGSDMPPIGVLARGCDGLGLARLIRDNRVAEDDLYVIGVRCRGVVDPDRARSVAGAAVLAAEIAEGEVVLTTARGEVRCAPQDCLMDKCLTCEDPVPEGAQVLLGDEGAPGAVGRRDFAGVAEIEALSPDERYRFWARQFERCLRCFACRNACPACSCVTCSLEDSDPEWLNRSTELSEQFMFHFTRAFHVAGRCVGCGECERVCPADIPLMLLNEKFMKDIGELFGVTDPHIPSAVEPLGKFDPEDPEGWRGEDERP